MKKTFKEFLTEKVTHGISQNDADINVIKSLLEKNCSKILNAYKSSGSLLYRGIRSEDRSIFFVPSSPRSRGDNDFVMGKSRDNRKSVDISKNDNQLFHDVFLKLGLKATRKNSIFTTTVKDSAKDWGLLYVIFPFDSANITWIDLDKLEYEYPYYALVDIMDEYRNDYDIKNKKISKIEFTTKEIKTRLKPVKDNLQQALKHKRVEVLVNGDYYGFSIDSKLWTKEIKPWLITR